VQKTVFGYIIAHSKLQQLYILVITVISFPFLYMMFELPKLIINDAIDGDEFPRSLPLVGTDLDQITFLWVLSGAFLAVVLINGGFKYYINIYRGSLGERMIRRLRYQLLDAVTRFPLPHFRNVSQGEIVSMVTAETEPLGGYMGNAVAVPVFQGGTLLTLLAFMFAQDVVLGLAAVSLYPIQGWLIPRLQKTVNRLNKQRIKHVRKTSERIGELVGGVSEIHNHDTARFELAELGKQLGLIYSIRWDIYRAKFFIKFCNNFIAQITPFFFYAIGGYLVINGELSFGAMVAVLAAYKDLSAPWKLLLQHYQRMEDARVKYDQLISQFQPPGLLPPRPPISGAAVDGAAEPDGGIHSGPHLDPLAGPVVVSGLVVEDEAGTRIIDRSSFQFDMADHVAFIGADSSGRSELARLLGRQIDPAAGQVTIGGTSILELSPEVAGRDMAYVDAESFIRSGTIRDNLLYGVKHQPKDDPDDPDWAAFQEESLRAGNSPHSPDADWLDLEQMGLASSKEIPCRLAAVLEAVGLDEDVLQIGQQQVIAPAAHPALAEGVVAARETVREQLATPEFAGLVELFDRDRFNRNATVAENILFGTPTDETFRTENLSGQPVVIEVLESAALTAPLLEIGLHVARLKNEMFRELQPGHEFFERFGFITADDLPPLQRILKRVASDGMEALRSEEQARLLGLTFRLQPARHRLAMIDDDLELRILEARRLFAERLPPELAPSIAFFDIDRYNPASTIQDNILFGKVVIGKANSSRQVSDLLNRVIANRGLRPEILAVGMGFETGISGKRLSTAQRQRLAVARCLIKRPRLLIVNGALASLDERTQRRILANLHEEQAGRGLIWVDRELGDQSRFDRVFLVENAGVQEPGKTDGSAVAGPRPVDTATAETGAGMRGEIDRLTDLLSGLPLFNGIDRGRLKLLAFTSETETHAAGDELYREGDTGDIGYVIVSGRVELSVEGQRGPRVVAVKGPGDILGELNLLSGAPRLETARALESSRLLCLTESVFGAIVQESLETNRAVTRLMADRLATATRQLTGGDALYDEASGLPNSDLLRDRMRLVVSQGARDNAISELVVLSIDGLDAGRKASWKVSESVLARQVAERLRACLRNADTLARLDDYRFGIIANASSRSAGVDVDIVIRRLGEALAEPLIAGGTAFPVADALAFESCSLTREREAEAETLIVGAQPEPDRKRA